MSKCLDRTRGGEVDREEEEAFAAEVRLESTLVIFDGRRAEVFEFRLEPLTEPFLDPLAEAALVDFAFKRMDLAGADERRTTFFLAFSLTLALVAINAATYTVNGPLKSRRPAAADLLLPNRLSHLGHSSSCRKTLKR